MRSIFQIRSLNQQNIQTNSFPSFWPLSLFQSLIHSYPLLLTLLPTKVTKRSECRLGRRWKIEFSLGNILIDTTNQKNDGTLFTRWMNIECFRRIRRNSHCSNFEVILRIKTVKYFKAIMTQYNIFLVSELKIRQFSQYMNSTKCN